MNYRRLYSRRKLIGYSQRNGGIQRNSVVHSEHATRPQPRTIVNTDGIGGGLLRRRLLSILILAAAVSSSLSNAAAFRERPRHFIVRVTVVDVRLTIDTCRAGGQSLSDELSSWSFYDAGGVPECIIYWGTIRAKRSLVDIHCRCPLLCRKLFSSVQSATASYARQLHYRRACPQRSYADIAFTQLTKNEFFAPHTAFINVKYGTGVRSAPYVTYHVYRGRSVRIQPSKLSKLGIFALQ